LKRIVFPPSHCLLPPLKFARNGRQEDLQDLQSNEDQGCIRAEGEDGVVYPLLIIKEVPTLKEAFVDHDVV
jgi:hypothetical protein